MDETTLHGLLTDALTDEPPMGPVAQHALRQGRRIRRQRRILAASGTGAALAAVGLSVTVALPAAGPPPAALGPGPTEHTVFAQDGGTGTITQVTPGSHPLGRTIQVGQDLSPAVFSPDGKILGVISYADDRLVTVDVAAGTVSQRFQPFKANTYPNSIAISPDDRTAYVSLLLGHDVLSFDLASGTTGSPINLGFTPQAIVIAPDGRTMYVLNPGSQKSSGKDAQGSVIPITLATGQAGQPIPVGDHPVAMDMSADGKRILVSNSEQGRVDDGSTTVIDTTTSTAGKPLATGHVSVKFAPDGQTAYLLDSNAATLTPLDLATQVLGKPVKLQEGSLAKGDDGPQAVAITPDGKTAYVLNPSLDPKHASTVTPVDTAAGTAGKPISVPGMDSAIAVSPDGQTVYVGSDQTARLIMISTSTNQVSRTVQVARHGDVEFATGP